MSGNDERLGDEFHVARDDEYLQKAQEEAEFWETPRPFSLDCELPIVDSYQNERFTGDEHVFWYETIANYGMFQSGCLLGTGGRKQNARILEQHPALHLTVYDISAGALAVVERDEGAKFAGRVATREADLNFAELPENTYDLVVSAGCFHHLLNLEHVASQVNRSLTSDGYFFLCDYVGESRCRFSAEKKQAFLNAFQGAQAQYPALQGYRPTWPDLDDGQYSPFECIRSDATLEILRRHLREESLRTAGTILALLMFVRRIEDESEGQSDGPRWRRRLSSLIARIQRPYRSRRDMALFRQLVAYLQPIDRELSDGGTLLPSNAFAVYRKRQ